MRFKEQYNPLMKGQVGYKLIRGGRVEGIGTIPNAIQANAKTLICKALADLSKLGVIEAYSMGSLLSSLPGLVTVVGIDTISLEVEFDEVSFTGTVDELRLMGNPVTDGSFSIVTGLSIYKDITSRLYIQWTIKFNDN